jgi:hypothetical protein
MKNLLPVLALFAGLGSSISCKHSEIKDVKPVQNATKQVSAPVRLGKPSEKRFPFDRYLDDQKTHWPEPALTRFAADCGVDMDAVKPRYAQNPSQKWILVKDLSKAMKDQETDFYATVAVWHIEDRVLVERWWMELDTGDLSRQFICLRNNRIQSAEEIDWSIPVEGESSSQLAWGYQQSWKLGADGKYENALRRFVDVYEQPMKEPKLDSETRNSLDWRLTIFTWKDLKLPSLLLQ